MKIKEVEQRVGIGRSNIRYYEREGFLRPDRDNENNYREYTEEDVQQLKRIKVLRMMGYKDEWTSRLQNILGQDIEKEVITRKQLNKHIMLMLVWGYFINAGITFFFGSKLIHLERAVLGMKGTPFDSGEMGIGIHSLETSFLFFAYVAVAVLCGIVVHCTANVKSQIVIFHISALITSPLIIECSRMFGKGSVQL